MFSRIKNSLVFRLEQFMVRGPMARFGIILLLVVLVSLVAGALVRLLAPGFESTADAIWWAFLRLTDPGYLGDDEGLAKASVSTAITVLGYILFMGALIAILVQWLGETMERLERGLTPVALDAHFVLLGWPSRTPTILEEIMVSQGRVERFLRRRGARRLYVALLAERADANLMQELRLEKGDRIAVLAPSYQDAAPPETIGAAVELPERPAPKCEVPAQRRVLVLGWNHRVPALLDEFASYPEDAFAIDIVSQVSATKREKRVAIEGISTERLKVRQLEFDYTLPAYLESVDPASYDNVVLLASERLSSGAESDARTILGYLLLRELLSAGAKAPPVLVELTDPDNVPLFENRRGETIVSPVIVSHMLARVTLRRELRGVFDELFSSGGCEIFFRRIADYGLVEILCQIPDYDVTGGEYTFADLQRAADARGEIAIGIRRAGQEQTPNGGVQLNPGRDERLELNEDDELIVLTTYE